jgi:Domain of unknown function (DUF1918)
MTAAISAATTDDTPPAPRFDSTMTSTPVEPRTNVRPGDWIAVHQIGGGTPRRGQIIEVLGRPGHERYRVRWDEQHVSIHFPSEGTSIERRTAGSGAAKRRRRPA